MAERREVVALARSGAAEVLATLVGVKGSSYRLPGARLLVARDGRTAGSISGGCLEGELFRRAKWLIRKGPVLQHYSTGFDDSSEIPFGLGCGGELDLLLETADSAEFQALFAAEERSFAGVFGRVVTWLPGEGEAGLRRLVLQRAMGGVEQEVAFASEGLSAEEVLWGRSLLPGEGWPRVFVEEIAPPQRLVVFGAGDDARAMVQMAASLGWSVVVADGRRQMARPERFAAAERVLVLEEEGAGAEVVQTSDAVVLMTHSYTQDRALLRSVLPRGVRYLGLLGARHRSSLLVTEVAEDLGWTVAACCERIHAPLGLDLGGDGAEVIALATVAEIQACLHGRTGRERRLDPERVAELAELGREAQYPEAVCALDGER